MKKAVQVVLLNENGEVLAVSRKNDHTDFGLVGGKVDEGESITEAIIRETKEETGLDIRNLQCIYQRFRDGRMGYTFLANYSGEIYTDEPHVVKWTCFDTINKGQFGEWNKIVMETLQDLEIPFKQFDIIQEYHVDIEESEYDEGIAVFYIKPIDEQKWDSQYFTDIQNTEIYNLLSGLNVDYLDEITMSLNLSIEETEKILYNKGFKKYSDND